MQRSSVLRRCSGKSLLGLAVTLALCCGGCGGKEAKCVDRSKPALDQCGDDVKRLQTEVNTLKKLLAKALTDPGSIKVDPSVLVIEGTKPGPGKRFPREGNISQAEVIRTLSQNKSSLEPCYNRALKRDSSLHHRKLVLNLSMKIRPSGSPSEIGLGPNYEAAMLDCMKKAIRRWRFPAFSGAPVGVESPLTFKPRK